ncbi:hypothetical protein DFA_02328 [Cavenderia fasciculata]|uniref:RING-type domain-containing protein n=1 Tax=Cavenderia fasciculata TaxID=261658 RepID=F4PZ53_CACFS|nr:uncharacterized protein DFA_02328 [Cavenderia fasciculata]EGG19082.1 hypothetical protein DFA_02328 [Cavenderia fasciculata]|eukprot:XP_004366715.1 hypothetical protein DFA_02328 [Cavenderia fasciculata]
MGASVGDGGSQVVHLINSSSREEEEETKSNQKKNTKSSSTKKAPPPKSKPSVKRAPAKKNNKMDISDDDEEDEDSSQDDNSSSEEDSDSDSCIAYLMISRDNSYTCQSNKCADQSQIYCEDCEKCLCKRHDSLFHQDDDDDEEEEHITIDINDYIVAKQSLSDPPYQKIIDNDEKQRRMISINSNNNDLEVGNQLAQNDATQFVVSVVGPPSAGKSTVIKQLLCLDNPDTEFTPRINNPIKSITTTADLNGFESMIGGVPVLLVDTESSGDHLPWTVGDNNDSTKKDNVKDRKSLVHTKHPQIVYHTSNVVVFVVDHPRRELVSVLRLIQSYTLVALQSQPLTSRKPYLIVVFNRQTPYQGGGRKWYENDPTLSGLFEKETYQTTKGKSAPESCALVQPAVQKQEEIVVQKEHKEIDIQKNALESCTLGRQAEKKIFTQQRDIENESNLILDSINLWYQSPKVIVIPSFASSNLGFIDQSKLLLQEISSICCKTEATQVDPFFESTYKSSLDLFNIKRNLYCSFDKCNKISIKYCETRIKFYCNDHYPKDTHKYYLISIEEYKQNLQKERILLSFNNQTNNIEFGSMWSTLSLANTKGQDYYLVGFIGQDVGNYTDDPISSVCQNTINCYVEYPNTVNNNKIIMVGYNQNDSSSLEVISLICDVIVVFIHPGQNLKEEIQKISTNFSTTTTTTTTTTKSSTPHLIIVCSGATENDIKKELDDKQVTFEFLNGSLQTSIESKLKNQPKKSLPVLKDLEMFVAGYNTKCTDEGCKNKAKYLFTGKFKCQQHYDGLVDRFKTMCMPIQEHLKSQHILGQQDQELNIKKEYDKRNKLLQEKNGIIEFGPKWYQCGLSNEDAFKLVTFIGPSGSGKSTLVRGLCHGDRPLLPLKGNQFSSTSSDINVYLGKSDEKKGTTKRFLMADCEGFGGTLNTATRTTGASRPSRREMVESAYPRILHSFSDIVVCVCSNSWQERQTISKYVLSHAQHSDSGAVNQGELPYLILVFNKKAKNEMNVTNQEATKEFFVNGGFDKLVEPYYRGWCIIRIGTDEGGRDPITFLNGYKELKKEIYNNLFGQIIKQTVISDTETVALTPREVIKQMGEVVHRFNDKVADQINFIEIHPVDPKRIASYLFKYFRLLYSKLSLSGAKDKYQSFGDAINKLNGRLEKSENLFGKRYPQEDWKKVIDMLTSQVGALEPCSTLNCNKYKHQHGNTHKSIGTEPSEKLINHLLKPKFIKHGVFAEIPSKHLRVVGEKSKISEISDDIEPIDNPKANDPYIQLSTHVCVNCLIGFPDQVRNGCQHLLCYHCSIESPDRCPMCNEDSHWINQTLPHNAGYRLLNLNDIGSQVVDSLIILKKIQKKLFDIDIRHLFDLSFGSGLAGLSLLFLTKGTNIESQPLDNAIRMIELSITPYMALIEKTKRDDHICHVLKMFFENDKSIIYDNYMHFTKVAITASDEGGVALFPSYNAERIKLQDNGLTYRLMHKTKAFDAAQAVCLSLGNSFALCFPPIVNNYESMRLKAADPVYDKNVNIVKEAQHIWGTDKHCDILLDIGTLKGFTHHNGKKEYLDKVKKVSSQNIQNSKRLLSPSTTPIFKLTPPLVNCDYFLDIHQIHGAIKGKGENIEKQKNFLSVCNKLLSSLFYVSKRIVNNSFSIKSRIYIDKLGKFKDTIKEKDFFKVKVYSLDKKEIDFLISDLEDRDGIRVTLLQQMEPNTKIKVRVSRKDILGKDFYGRVCDPKYFEISGHSEIELTN